MEVEAVVPTEEQPQTVQEINSEPLNEQALPEIVAPVKKPVSLLPESTEFQLAKSFLTSKIGVKHPVSMYDHLTRVIQHVLEQRPSNAVGRLGSCRFF